MIHVRTECLFNTQRHFRSQGGFGIEKVGECGAADFQYLRSLRHCKAEGFRLGNPFMAPLSGCAFHPGKRPSCSTVAAVSMAKRSLRSLSAMAGSTPLAFPSPWSSLSLCAESGQAACFSSIDPLCTVIPYIPSASRQQMFLNLPHRVAGEFVDDDELPRNLERCELLAAARFHHPCIETCRRDDISHRYFAAYAIGQADRCSRRDSERSTVCRMYVTPVPLDV